MVDVAGEERRSRPAPCRGGPSRPLRAARAGAGRSTGRRPSGRSRRRGAAARCRGATGRPRRRRRAARSRPRGGGSRGRGGRGRSCDDQQVVEVAAGVLDDPVPDFARRTSRARSSVSTRAARESMKIARTPSMSRQKLQRVPAAVVSISLAQLAQGLRRVRVAPHLRVELVLVELARREVAEVLVDPVAHDPADGPLVPPVLAVHLLVPGARDVPVVAHVVVVPGHRGRDGREQPADQRVLPGLAW